MNHSELYETISFPIEHGNIRINRTTGKCNFPPHWHEHVEMLYVESGSGKMLCHDTVYTLKPGDLIIVNSNTLHAGKGCSDDFSYLCLLYSQSIFDCCRNEGFPEFRPFVSGDQEVLSIMQRISEATDSSSDYMIFRKNALAYALLYHLSTHQCSHRFPDSDFRFRLKNQDRLNTVTSYIQSNLDNPYLSNKTLSELVHLNEYYFCHVFSQAFLESPRSYIQNKRMEHACHLLKRTELSVTHIGRKCGMDPNYFSRSFRKRFGVSPQEYRKENRCKELPTEDDLASDKDKEY